MKLIMENFNKFLAEEEGETSDSPQPGELDFIPKMEMVYTTKDGKTLLVIAGGREGEVVFEDNPIMAGQEAINAIESKEEMVSFLTDIKNRELDNILNIPEGDTEAFYGAVEELLASGLLDSDDEDEA